MDHRSTLSPDEGGLCAEHTGSTDALKLSGPGHISPTPGGWTPWAQDQLRIFFFFVTDNNMDNLY